MKVGTFAYATDQGLGVLARSFYRAGVVTDVLVVRHGSRPTHDDWYPGATHVHARHPDFGAMARFCDTVDAMLFFETPFHWAIFDHCRTKGVKTFLMPMYECTHASLPYAPDVMLCPSLLDLLYYVKGGIRGAEPFKPYLGITSGPVYLTPVPVETPWRLRTRANVFVHNMGNGGLRNRNGTGKLLDALRLSKAPFKLILRSQDRLPWVVPDDPRIDLRIGTTPYEQLFDEGDVFVFPETFNGLSLPLQEACAAGMLVMGSDRFPMNAWLPTIPLIKVLQYNRTRIGPAFNEFGEAVIDPSDIAGQMDRWYGADIELYSRRGKEWADEHSWEKLAPRYQDVLNREVLAT